MLTINGKPVEAVGRTLSEYLKETGYDIKRIAVEKNGEIAPKKDYDSIVLSDGDKLEIVSFVGGG
ncbi:MAG: sulfur carrier protein ThiS [Selenomonadaceae bacterium]|nr:sulfur carrier protein ThiS [Selenomonadaceae bacterium]